MLLIITDENRSTNQKLRFRRGNSLRIWSESNESYQ